MNYVSFAFDKSYDSDSNIVKNELLTYFNNRFFYHEGVTKRFSCDKTSFYSQNKENSRLYNVMIRSDSSIKISIFHINKYGEKKPFSNTGEFRFRENILFIEDTCLTPLSLFIADCVIASSIK
jgi:hypothetical protein